MWSFLEIFLWLLLLTIITFSRRGPNSRPTISCIDCGQKELTEWSKMTSSTHCKNLQKIFANKNNDSSYFHPPHLQEQSLWSSCHQQSHLIQSLPLKIVFNNLKRHSLPYWSFLLFGKSILTGCQVGFQQRRSKLRSQFPLPLKNRSVIITHSVPWFSHELWFMKAKCQQLEHFNIKGWCRLDLSRFYSS